MTASPENRENSLSILDTTLTGLEQQAPSIEVFEAIMKFSNQLVEVYMGLSSDSDREVVQNLDQRSSELRAQLLRTLQAVEERRAAEVVALHTRAPKTPMNHGRRASLRQMRDTRPQDRARMAA